MTRCDHALDDDGVSAEARTAEDRAFVSAMRRRLAARPLTAGDDELAVALTAGEAARLIRLAQEALESRVEDFTAQGTGSLQTEETSR